MGENNRHGNSLMRNDAGYDVYLCEFCIPVGKMQLVVVFARATASNSIFCVWKVWFIGGVIFIVVEKCNNYVWLSVNHKLKTCLGIKIKRLKSAVVVLKNWKKKLIWKFPGIWKTTCISDDLWIQIIVTVSIISQVF